MAVGALRTGLAVDASGPRSCSKRTASTFPNVTTFAVLDLTDTDAVLDAGGAVLDGAIDALLTALGDSAAAAAAVRARSGLRRPDGTDAATWPHEVTLAEFFADPLDAVAATTATCSRPGAGTASPRSSASLVRLAGGGAGVTGSGTGRRPWTAAIAVGRHRRADLLAWSTAGDDGTRLHLGDAAARCPPTTLAAGAEVGLAITAELVSLCLAGVGGAAPLDPRPLPALSAALELGDDLHLDLGPLGIAARPHQRRGALEPRAAACSRISRSMARRAGARRGDRAVADAGVGRRRTPAAVRR